MAYIFAVAVIGLLGVVLFADTIERLVYATKSTSYLRRVDLWQISWEGFLAQPLWGWGSYAVGNAAWDVPVTRAMTGMMKDTTMASPHSLPLTILVQSGIIGGLLYNVVLFGGLVKLARLKHAVLWPLIGALCYFHGAGMVSRAISFMPGLLIWGGLFGVLVGNALSQSVGDTAISRGALGAWWREKRRIIGGVCGAGLLFFLGVRMWWDDHVYAHPRALLDGITQATVTGDPISVGLGGVGILDFENTEQLLPWRVNWTCHTDVTTYKTLSNFRKMMSQESNFLRTVMSQQVVQLPAWTGAPRLTAQERTWVRDGIPSSQRVRPQNADIVRLISEIAYVCEVQPSQAMNPRYRAGLQQQLHKIGLPTVLTELERSHSWDRQRNSIGICGVVNSVSCGSSAVPS